MSNLSDLIGKRNTFSITSPSGRYDKESVVGSLEFGYYKFSGKFIKTDSKKRSARGAYVLLPVEIQGQESMSEFTLGLEGLHFIYDFKKGIYYINILDEDLLGENPFGNTPAEITEFLKSMGKIADSQSNLK